MAQDGWTQVPRKSKPGVNFSRHLPQSLPAIVSNIDRTNPPSRAITSEHMIADYRRKLNTWRQDQSRQATLRILDRVRPDSGWNVSTAVCLASGSFSRDNLEGRRRSMWQMVVFVDLSRHLREDLKMVAQDPAYTAMDRLFLQSLGIEVLDVNLDKQNGLGAAREYMGNETFVFEPFLDMDAVMMRQVLDADLALYVGSSIRGLMGRTNEVGELAMKYHEVHRMYNFPEFEVDPNVLGGMGIHWREEQEEDKT
ncbi:hypothetical protein DOTSEDRAFT_171280 [Dothistroma septosporum NZE10]|uniref:SRR1-like domain-containing protein n=1 Tax=Dothistroma septosporum (strain NZE10 / CBS 128990) TaxID=675120 RepID=N1PRY0_DOTSN|nr:hypothetical protein DOTSEDRAFT_171280 [Dothistroma septosporum NZE10]